MLYNLIELDSFLLSILFTSIIIVAFTEYIKVLLKDKFKNFYVILISMFIGTITSLLWNIEIIGLLQNIFFYILWVICISCSATLFYDILLKSIKDLIKISLNNIKKKKELNE